MEVGAGDGGVRPLRGGHHPKLQLFLTPPLSRAWRLLCFAFFESIRTSFDCIYFNLTFPKKIKLHPKFCDHNAVLIMLKIFSRTCHFLGLLIVSLLLESDGPDQAAVALVLVLEKKRLVNEKLDSVKDWAIFVCHIKKGFVRF